MNPTKVKFLVKSLANFPVKFHIQCPSKVIVRLPLLTHTLLGEIHWGTREQGQSKINISRSLHGVVCKPLTVPLQIVTPGTLSRETRSNIQPYPVREKHSHLNSTWTSFLKPQNACQ